MLINSHLIQVLQSDLRAHDIIVHTAGSHQNGYSYQAKHSKLKVSLFSHMSWELLIHWKCEGISENNAVLIRIVSVSAYSENSHCLSMAKNSTIEVRVYDVCTINWCLTNRGARLELDDHWTLSTHIDPEKSIQ